MLQPSAVQAATFLATLVCCLLLILTTRWHGRLSLDTTVGLQKFHSSPTPRIGGLATLAGLVAGYGVAPEAVRQLLGPLLVASLPAFCAGLLEDVTKQVGVRVRLLATILSGFLAWHITGFALTRTGVPGLDTLLTLMPVSVLFTAVAIGGVANAVNIIDGFNGLAGGVLSIMFVALGIIAGGVGDSALAATCWAFAGCSLGFTLVNWPFGKIFLGDGGAYQLGFAVGWIAVLLVVRNPVVPAWAPLMVCAYPVLEVAFSIVRKSRRTGYNPGLPDRVHLHMLVHRRVVRPWLTSRFRSLHNGMTSPFAWAYASVLAAWGTLFAQRSGFLIAGFIAAVAVYGSIYTRLTRFRWWPAARLTQQPRRAQPRRAPDLKAVEGSLRDVPLAGNRTREAKAPEWDVMQRPWQSVRQDARRESRAAVLGYGMLGLSTCLTMIEPAPFELIALPLILASWVQHVLTRARPYTPASATLVFLLALFSVLQVLPVLGVARDLLHAAQYAAITALLIVIGIHLGRLFGEGDAKFRAFARGYCVAALLSATVAIGSLYVGVNQAVPEWLLYAGRPKAFFKDPNVLGPYLVPAVVGFLYMAGQVRSFSRLLYVSCALVCAFGVISTASRGAWINLAIAVAVYGLLGRGRVLAVVLAVAISCLLVLLIGRAGAYAPDVLELFTGRTQLQWYDADRFYAARQAWELGLRYPLGVGPGGIAKYMDPHNTYVRIWAENGPAALLLFLLIIGGASAGALRAWFNARGRAQEAVAVGLALLVGVLVNAAAVDALHWRHFWVLLGLCVFSSHAWRKRVPSQGRPLNSHRQHWANRSTHLAGRTSTGA